MSNIGYGKRDLSHLFGGRHGGRFGGRFGRRRSRFERMFAGGGGGSRARTVAVVRDVGDSARHFARRVGPGRGLIGLLVLGTTILGSMFLIRRMRSRREEIEGQTEEASGRKLSSRKRRRAMNEYIASTAH